MQTKTIAAVSAVMFGLGTALMGTTALSQTTTGTTEEPILQQDQAGTQTGTADDPLLPEDQAGAQTGTATDQTGTGMAQPGTGTEQPATGMAQDTDPAAPDTGVAQDDTVSPGTGMAADDGLPRRSVGMAGEPYAGEVLAGVTADELIGMNVVDAAGDNVGSINDLLFGSDNQVDHAIVDVGGFLGFGAKSVAIPIEEITVSPDQDQVVTNMTREQLDAMPEWQRGDEGWMAN